MTTVPILRWSHSENAGSSNDDTARSEVRVYNIKSSTDAVLWFFNNPQDDPERDWYTYKELRAFAGLRSGHRLPGGLAVFPAVANDPLTSLIEPTKFDENGVVYPKKVWAVNAIFISGKMGEAKEKYEPMPNEHIIVKFSANLGGQARIRLLDEGPDFDCRDYAWRLSVDVPKDKNGEPIYTMSTLRMQKQPFDKTDTYDIPSYSIPAIMEKTRLRVEEWVRSINDEMANSGAVKEPIAVEDPFADGSESIDELEAAVAALHDGGATSDPFDGVSDTRLKKLLQEAGVAAPRGASRGVLVNLANQVGWFTSFDLPTEYAK